MKITVERSGGFAGMKQVWTVRPAPPADKDYWQPLVEACPWDAVPASRQSIPGGGPDRFTYSIRAGRHRAVLPEQALTGPWRDLVEHARAAAEPARAGQGPDEGPDQGPDSLPPGGGGRTAEVALAEDRRGPGS